MITAEIQQMEIHIASNLIELEDRIKDVLNKPEVREGVRIVAAMLIGLALAMFARYAFATDGAEFASGSTTVEGWAKGNPGKITALAGVLYGSLRAMFVKDYGAFLVPSGIGIAMGVIVSIIDASYTAII